MQSKWYNVFDQIVGPSKRDYVFILVFCNIPNHNFEINMVYPINSVTDCEVTSLKELHDMTPRDVKDWLIQQVGIPSSVATRFEEECVDGRLLRRYEMCDLQDDFKLSMGITRKVIYARDDLIKTTGDDAVFSQSNVGINQASEKLDESSHFQIIGKEGSDQQAVCQPAHEVFEETPSAEIEQQIKGDSLSPSGKPRSNDAEPNNTTHESLSKEERSAEEAKLRFLLTGDESGSLDNSFHPLLIVNKPQPELLEESEVKKLQEKLGFVSLVNWNAVFDCDSMSMQNGLCSSSAREERDQVAPPGNLQHSNVSRGNGIQ